MKTITILISWLLGFMLSAQTASNLSVLITPASKCEQQGCIDITINGGHSPYMVEWWGNAVSNSEIVVNGSSDLADLCNIPAGNYWLYITDAWCGAIYYVFTVPEQNASIEVLSLQHVSKCEGNICDGAITITAAGEAAAEGKYITEWYNEQGYSIDGGEDVWSIKEVCSGTYTVELYTQDGCLIDTKKIEVCCCKPDANPNVSVPTCDGVIEAKPLEVTAATTVVPTLDNPTGGSINIDVSIPDYFNTPIVYQWTGPNGYTASTQDISGLGPGNYCVVITTGCSYKIKKCYELYGCDLISLNVTVIDPCDSGFGIVKLFAQYGKAPYQYIYKGEIVYTGSGSFDLDNLSTGIHTLTVIDANKCQQQLSFTFVGEGNIDENCNFSCGNHTIPSVIEYHLIDLETCLTEAYCSMTGTVIDVFSEDPEISVDEGHCILSYTCPTSNYTEYAYSDLYPDLISGKDEYYDGGNLYECYQCYEVAYCQFQVFDKIYYHYTSIENNLIPIENPYYEQTCGGPCYTVLSCLGTIIYEKCGVCAYEVCSLPESGYSGKKTSEKEELIHQMMINQGLIDKDAILIKTQEETISNSPADIEVFPNPFYSNLSVRFNIDTPTTSNIDVEVADLLGRTLYRASYPVVVGNNTVILDNLQHLSQGIYTLKILNEYDVLYNNKIVKTFE